MYITNKLRLVIHYIHIIYNIQDVLFVADTQKQKHWLLDESYQSIMNRY